MTTHRRPQGGFTLLEVLISLVLVAIALLGSAALQAYSTKLTQGGQFRSQAVVVGMDVLERIEANNAGAVLGSYVGVLPGRSGAPDCVASACGASDIAQFDLYQVQQNLQQQLPGASAVVTRTGAGPYVYTVQVSWKERAYRAKSAAAAVSDVETFSFTVSRTIYDKSAVL